MTCKTALSIRTVMKTFVLNLFNTFTNVLMTGQFVPHTVAKLANFVAHHHHKASASCANDAQDYACSSPASAWSHHAASGRSYPCHYATV